MCVCRGRQPKYASPRSAVRTRIGLSLSIDNANLYAYALQGGPDPSWTLQIGNVLTAVASASRSGQLSIWAIISPLLFKNALGKCRSAPIPIIACVRCLRQTCSESQPRSSLLYNKFQLVNLSLELSD